MPTVVVEGFGVLDVPAGKKLVLALENGGVDILHRCGGNARCVTCRVEVLEGDPGPMSESEQKALAAKDIKEANVRLSCQIRVQGDLKVKPVMTAIGTGLEPGPTPKED